MKPRHFLILAVLVFAGIIHAQPVTYISLFAKGDDENKPVPKELQGLPHCVTVNNDDATIKPMVFHDPVTGNFIYVESDGRHVTAISADGKIVWSRNPFVDAKLEPYRCTKPIIVWVGRAWVGLGKHRENRLGITFNSSQFGDFDDRTGDFRYRGQD